MEKWELMSPKIDFAFKELMQNDEAREKFLGATLKIDEKQIQNTILENTILRKEHAEDKYGILDVRVQLEDGTEIDVEIQVAALSIWADRSLYYVSKMFTDTIKESEPYSELKKCVGISILDFNLWKDENFFHSCFKLLETQRHFLYTDKMEFHVIELPKVREEIEEQDSLHSWGCFFNAKTKEEFEMLVEKNPNLGAAYEQLKRVSADKEKRAEYIRREKEIRDQITYLEFAKKEGREQGREEGREQGREEKALQDAQNFLQMGLTAEQVAKGTGLPLKTVKELAEKNK